MTDAASRELALKPMVATLPAEFQQSGKDDRSDAYAFGLASAGSAGMGTDLFTILLTKSLT